MDKMKIPLQSGIKLVFDNPPDALALVTAGQSSAKARAMAHVDEGGIIRFDAMIGEQLMDHVGAKEMPDGSAILMDKWYGTIVAVGLAVGPFERKSQAMNGLALTLLGFEVEGVLSEESKAVDKPTGDGFITAEAEDGATTITFSVSSNGSGARNRLGKAFTNLGVSDGICETLVSHSMEGVPSDGCTFTLKQVDGGIEVNIDTTSERTVHLG